MKQDSEEHGGDKRKLEDNNEPQRAKKKKWRNRGVNKNRPMFKFDLNSQLCPRLVDRHTDTDPGCDVESCKFTHDLAQYMETKLPSLGEDCHVFNTTGHCPRGITCRFSSKHVTDQGLNIVNEIQNQKWKSDPKNLTSSNLSHEIQVQLRRRTYNFDKSEAILTHWSQEVQKEKEAAALNGKQDLVKEERDTDVVSSSVDGESAPALDKEVTKEDDKVYFGIGPVVDYDIFRMKEEEKRKIDWRGKLFLSPLTTVGNLPFRRVCKRFGADVTCGEMALATNLLQGKPQEWALTKRHGSEDLFGVQVCGNNTNIMTRCAQILQEQADIDFMDINVGCPIDLIFQQGAGSGLLNKKKMLFSIVKCMKGVLKIPLTVKTRTGVYSGKNVVHNFMQDLTNAGADLITIHGRTKEQRYTKLADWEYIERCAKLATPTPVIGNGDILSYEDYDLAREKSPSAASIMIGRGALIKPWIFTELKERRHWDISSKERMDMLRDYTNFGLEHWGSDTKGVENTRRFLLEWLSFLYRYVPVGLMETPPQKMNERPGKFQCRDDLEELMASANSADWIKISEMLLGPVPEGFQFLPKHKANSWT